MAEQASRGAAAEQPPRISSRSPDDQARTVDRDREAELIAGRRVWREQPRDLGPRAAPELEDIDGALAGEWSVPPRRTHDEPAPVDTHRRPKASPTKPSEARIVVGVPQPVVLHRKTRTEP